MARSLYSSFFFSSRRRHTRFDCDWSSDVCSSDLYTGVDLDLLLTGVVLHDIGKIYELNYERGFSYSDDGQLLGHINIGLRMVADKVRCLPDFPPRLRTLVDHMILSHHGQ